MNLNELSQEIHAISKSKGFYEPSEKKNTGEVIALVHSELSEALEADRNGYNEIINDDILTKLGQFDNETFKKAFELHIKDTFADEWADALIRILDFAAYKKMNIEQHVKLKMRYNSLRPYKHGKNY